MSDDSISKAPRTEDYQAIKDGFWQGRYYNKGNIRSFGAGEDVPFYFKPIAQISEEHQRAQAAQVAESAGRLGLDDVGIKKVATVAETVTAPEIVTTEIEVKPETVEEKPVKVKRKYVRKKK